MGIVHYAYYIDANALRAGLSESIERTGRLTPDVLLNEARTAFERCSGAGKDFLESIRFDRDWLHAPSAPDAYRTDELFKVLIARQIQSSHALSLSSFGLLEVVLPVLGWPERHTRLLLVGHRLARFARDVGMEGPLAFDPFPDNTSWLGGNEAKMLLSLLGEIEKQMRAPPDAVLAAIKAECSPVFECFSRNLLLRAYVEISERLQLAVRHAFDIILVNDVSTHRLDKSKRLEAL